MYIDLTDPDEDFDDVEYEVRKIFNREIAPLVIDQYGPDDEIALNEAFNNWTDALCKDGLLHEKFYNEVTRSDD